MSDVKLGRAIDVSASYAAYLARKNEAVIIKKIRKAIPLWDEAFPAYSKKHKFIPLAEMQRIYREA